MVSAGLADQQTAVALERIQRLERGATVGLALRISACRFERLLGHGAQIAKIDVGGRKLMFQVSSVGDGHVHNASARALEDQLLTNLRRGELAH